MASCVGAVLFGGLLAACFALDRHTRSDTFCGQTCHRAMAPQDVAHLSSVHAVVPCVGCHVGSGAWNHVTVKLRGAQHLWALLRNDFARPIRATDVRSRVTDDRCLACHSLARIPQSKLRQLPRYLYDESNSAWQVSLTLHIGALERSSTSGGGVMWHMAKPSRVRFASTDPAAALIPWVRVQRADGSATTYVARNTTLDRSALDQLPQRDLTCTECHNRTGHDLTPLDSALDRALFNGEISSSLPSVKRRISQVLAEGDRLDGDVVSRLQNDLQREAQLEDPMLAQLRRSEVSHTAAFAARLHANTVFPALRVLWGSYPTEIGHRFARGCFRCHDGEHVDSSGKAIPNDCDSTCHAPPRMGPIDPSRIDADPEADSWHPWQLPIAEPRIVDHDRLVCSDCHANGLIPKRSCEDCHHPPGL